MSGQAADQSCAVLTSPPHEQKMYEVGTTMTSTMFHQGSDNTMSRQYLDNVQTISRQNLEAAEYNKYTEKLGKQKSEYFSLKPYS